MGVSKIIIVGAPRSGTNMLRDILTSFDDIATWPCDEINYIWRHGNILYPSDEIPAMLAKPEIIDFINKSFLDISKRYNSNIIVEKTCANSLRLPFVDAVLPDAKYIFIHRDGIDTTGSAKKRWTAKPDIRYIFAKVRFVPLTDIPYYGVRYLWGRVYQFFSREKRLAFWGPVLKDMSVILQSHNLNEVCALQWQHCVEKSEEAFSKIPSDRVIRISYEDFVLKPKQNLSNIMQFIGKDVMPEEIAIAVKDVFPQSIGKGRKALSEQEVKNLESLVGKTLKRYDYL